MAEQPTDDPQSFVAFLATVRPETVDELSEELSEELQALVAKIRETGGAGQITPMRLRRSR